MSAVALWGVALCVYSLCYPALRWVLKSHPNFQQANQERQLYILSNVLKGVVLGISLPYTITLLYKAVVFDEWNGVMLQCLAPMYCALDLVSLLIVPNMAWSTVAHHVFVVAFGIYSTLHVAEPHTFLAHVCLYALFSQVAYFVNLWLALRFIVNSSNKDFHHRISWVCAIGYGVVCAVHWSVQLQGVYYGLWYLPFAFATFVYDDIVLIRWLLRL